MALSEKAIETFARNGVTPEEYAAKVWTDGLWHGDSCGCTDDRCNGKHHAEGAHCNCLDAQMDSWRQGIVF